MNWQWQADYLFSEAGRIYLEKEYVQNNRSTYDLAAEREVYANVIRRALVFHGIKLRSKGEAQKIACKLGRHKRGKNRVKKQKRRS
jgi:hypothetical protein